jgi:hypothetical protein
MQHIFAFALTPDDRFPHRPHQPKRFRRPTPNPGEPDRRVLIASVAVGATSFALLWVVATVTVP